MSKNIGYTAHYVPREALLLIIMALMALWTSSALAVPALTTDDSYTIESNFTLTVNAASGLVANDSGFNVTTHRIESYDTRSAFGGNVSVNADGSFTYSPPVGFVGVDTFAYLIRTDEGAASAIVRVNVTGPTIWFVDASAPVGGNGSYASPFNSFASLNSGGDVDSPDDTIFVYEGTYSVSLTLENGQRLIGEGQGLSVPNAGVTIPAGNAPIFNASGVNTLTLASDNTVQGVTLRSSNGYAIIASNVGGLTVENVLIQNAAGGISLSNFSSAVSLTNVTINTALSSAFAALFVSGGNAIINLVNSPITSSIGHPLYISGYSGTLTFDSASDMTGTIGKGVFIANLTSSAFVTLAGVNVTTTNARGIELQNNNANAQINFEEGVTVNASGGEAFISYLGGGKLKIGGTGSSLTSSGQAALHLSGVELTQDAILDNITSNSSAAYGVFIQNPVGANDITVGGTTILDDVGGLGVYIEDSASPSGFALSLNKTLINSTSTGIAVAGASVSVTDVTSTLSASGGAALSCSDGTMNLAFATLSAAGGPSGLSFSECSGTITAAGGTLTSTTGAANHVVSITNSTVNLTYNGTINKTNTGSPLIIDGLATPGAVTFGGAVTASNSSGVSIQNSTRPVTFSALTLGSSLARYSFTPLILANNTGAIDLGVFKSYTSGSGFALQVNYANASPGTVTTDAGSVLDTTGSGLALYVTHSTGQPVNLTFDSISSTGSGIFGIDIDRASGTFSVTGRTNLSAKTTAALDISNSSLVTTLKELDISLSPLGVRLVNNTGSFTISGDGDATLHTDGAGGTLSGFTQTAFNFNTVTNITLNDLQINNVDNDALFGTGVVNMTLDNVDVSDVGDASGDYVMDFLGGGRALTGTVTLDNVYFTNMSADAMRIYNTSGTLGLNISNSEFEDNISKNACSGVNCSGNGVYYYGDGTSDATININNTTFDRIDLSGIFATATGASAARLTLNVIGNTFDGQAYVGGSDDNSDRAVFIPQSTGNSSVTTRIEGNTINNHAVTNAGVIDLTNAEFQQMNATILNNNITFYSPIGYNITLTNTMNTPGPSARLIARVEGNTLAGGNRGAIYTSATGDGPSQSHFNINGNQIANAPASPNRAVYVRLSTLEPTALLCSNITLNTINAAPQTAIFVSRATTSGQMTLQGMSGTGDANAITCLQTNNNETGTVTVSTGNTIINGVCLTP